MIVHVDGTTWCGAVADLRSHAVDGASVAGVVRGTADDESIAVACPTPGPVHERAGYVHSDVSLRSRTALAAAARSRGLTAPQDDERAAIREQLRSMEGPDLPADGPSSTDDRADLTRVRERVAELRGRVETLRQCGRDAADAEADLVTAVRELSERETERAARQQRRDRRREQERTLRNHREKRRRLEDRAANLDREARAYLVERLADEFASAVGSVAGADVSDPFDAPPPVAALAVLRVADVRAPVVLACDRFSDPAAAADWLGAPVIRL